MINFFFENLIHTFLLAHPSKQSSLAATMAVRAACQPVGTVTTYQLPVTRKPSKVLNRML